MVWPGVDEGMQLGRGGTGMRMRSLTFAPSRATQRIESRSRHLGMIIVEEKKALERKKLLHQGGSLAGVVSGGGPGCGDTCCHRSRVELGYG